MIAVVVLAPLLAIGACLNNLRSHLDEMYGPEGLLARQQRFWAEVSAASEALQQGRWSEAEVRYRSALALSRSASEYKFVIRDAIGDEAIPLLGLADALAGQGRFDEAGSFYKRALARRKGGFGDARLEVANILDRYASTLRKMGRLAQANDLEAQAGTIRGKLGQEHKK